MNIKEFVSKHGISIDSQRAPLPADSFWSRQEGASAWNCKLSYCNSSGDRVTFVAPVFYMGPALKNPPTAEELLDSLIMDAMSADDQSFESWCSDFGLNHDSIKDKKTYDSCLDTSRQLKAWLGEERFEELRACERL